MESGPGREGTFLVFHVGELRLGLAVEHVDQILRAVAVARLPGGPPGVEGVINARGETVPVLDIRGRFAQLPAPVEPNQRMILARANGRRVVLRVDRVTDLVSIGLDQIGSAADVAPGLRHVAGVARMPFGLLVIQDLERFLSHEESVRLDLAMQEADGADGLDGGGAP